MQLHKIVSRLSFFPLSLCLASYGISFGREQVSIGFCAMQIIETSLAVALAYFYMPKTPTLESSILQVC